MMGIMPWKRVLPMEEKMAFILAKKEGKQNFAALCRLYEISRKTGYKWWARYQKVGLEGLRERTHRPHGCPHASAPVWTERIVALRLRHPSWKPKKLRMKLLKQYGQEGLPAASTLGQKLKASGLVRARRRRDRRPVRPLDRLTVAQSANQVWAVDFKGWFRTGDGQRCDPLTMSDLFSRYVLCCQVAVNQGYEAVQPLFDRVFELHGLPEVIRVDNGCPFASSAIGGLSRLSAWWVRLGIKPEFIAPGHPEQNGAHERMHRTLKAETTQPAARTAKAQQERFEQWRRQFNEERPHEALGQEVPASLYQLSQRRYSRALRPLAYPADYLVRRVRSNGQIRWQGTKRYVSEALIDQLVGLRSREAGRLQVWLGNYLIGELHEGESGGLRPSVSVPQTRQHKQKLLPMCPV